MFEHAAKGIFRGQPVDFCQKRLANAIGDDIGRGNGQYLDHKIFLQNGSMQERIGAVYDFGVQLFAVDLFPDGHGSIPICMHDNMQTS